MDDLGNRVTRATVGYGRGLGEQEPQLDGVTGRWNRRLAPMLANSGINLHQPAVRQAADACVGVTHGVVTRAVVARFVAGE